VLRQFVRRLRCERGDGLLDGLLVLGLVVLVVAVVIQVLMYAHARSLAEGAAQDGARTGAAGGAGVARANDVLAAGGGAAEGLRATSSTNDATVTVEVAGRAPRVFPIGLALPRVSATATLPVERYPELERRP
jgi:hypothetical protein